MSAGEKVIKCRWGSMKSVVTAWGERGEVGRRQVSPDLEGGWGTGMGGAGGATADKAYNMYIQGGLGGARP